MSAAIGWIFKGDTCKKQIGEHLFEIVEWKNAFSLMIGIGGRKHVLFVATRPTLEECQQLAEATVLLWSGENAEG